MNKKEIDIDKNNNIYIATSTQSTNFPVTNSFQNYSNGNQEGCIVNLWQGKHLRL